MKNYVLCCFLFLLASCNDGDLQIETLDFDSITTVENCDDLKANQTNVVFKINDDEALILTLAAAAIQNDTTSVVSLVPTQSKLTYRIFSDNVSTSYFCDAIPPTVPTVIDEIEANGGEVLITTTAVDTVTYSHKIELSGISLETSDNSRITDLRIENFGTITTKVEE